MAFGRALRVRETIGKTCFQVHEGTEYPYVLIKIINNRPKLRVLVRPGTVWSLKKKIVRWYP